jgi:hypothetical protein
MLFTKALSLGNRLCAMLQSAESWLPNTQHSEKFLQKISSPTPRMQLNM